MSPVESEMRRRSAQDGVDVCTLANMALLLRALSLAILLTAAPAAVLAGDPAAGQGERTENRQAEPSASSEPSSICQALATAAAANELPIEFFTRLIWQESRFKPEVVSRAGAQGVAQFMPGTARLRGVEDPFNPLEAIAKSAQLLRDLNREFGNLGFAAAAYNAGPGRVRDWLGGRRPLPGETRAYVRLVTGRTAEEWAAGQRDPVEMPFAKSVPCSQVAVTLGPPTPDAPPLPPERIKPWGVELVGGPTPAKALTRYRELQSKYAAILSGHDHSHVVIRGVIGEMGAARVRVDSETRADATKLCADLRSAGWYCDVLRN
jgi:transglycosylase-like protein with SLT domain